jgi:HK97 family phage prohead protease
MMFKIRDFDLQLKAAGKAGEFEGHGSVFNVVDTYNEVVAPGAFTASLADRAAKGRPLPVLWQHNAAMPIGVYTEVSEDSKGLRVKGRLLVDDVVLAREAYALLKAEAVSGLSIGYWVRESSLDQKTGIRTLAKLDLEEVSLVTFPANDSARVDAVKLKMARGALPSLPEFETFLRDAGMSRTKAAAIASGGLANLLSDSGEPANKAAASDLAKALRGLSLPRF